MDSLSSKIRILAVLLSTAAGILGVEWGLRSIYPQLPSISALEGSDFRLERLVDLAENPDGSLCHEVRTFLSHRSRWGTPGAASGVHFSELANVTTAGDGQVVRYGSGAADRRLWIAGDSLAYGLGVDANKTLGAVLSVEVTKHTGGAVDTRNLAVPGAGYCTVSQRVAGALTTKVPDLVLLVLSADDLEERLMLVVDGALVAPPDLASGRLVRWFVGRSWFANLLWFRVTAMREATEDGPKRFVGAATKSGFKRAMGRLKTRIEAKGGVMVVAIVEPPGMPLCSGSLMQARCEWLKEDMRTMADLLKQADVTHMTASGIWSGRLSDIVPREHSIAKRGMLAMHPSAVGHQRISDAIWPMLKDAM